ncbi:putative dipeptidase [Gregarina niphandrodes]|uniref:Dipeptidase n=1 Tax=Gregarina niphandrodes TaxID=110365 RepID=A0A023BC59_GRENI|nr:putative dipeptidase [Gregarina niphandrodes]EZG81695.1 putative dipeptidase [Gregarina niphandrodes]|eukprot:XP_011134201.1 putative dipeptidase [Gregarina niphandrodes]
MTKEAVIGAIENSEEQAVALLAEAVAIKSVSCQYGTREKVREMATWIKGQLLKSHPEANVRFEEIEETQTFPDGSMAKYPPLVFADMARFDGSKKTVLIYAHYDVQPAEQSDGWDTDPWQLTRLGKQLRGRGSTDDKGPLVGWLYVFAQYAAAKKAFPVNVKLVLEGMEESGSVGFDTTVARHKKENPSWWEQVDYCVVSDNYWLTTEKPCLSYGLRGVNSYEVAVEGPAVDLHSGVFSGAVYQPLDDLLYVLNKLKGEDDRMLIPGVYDQVAPVTPEEEKMYDNLCFNLKDFQDQIGVKGLRHENVKDLLMARWRHPTLTIHGIEGAFSEPGFKTVIPRKVIGKFSIRVVPNQTCQYVDQKTVEYVQQLAKERKTANKITVTPLDAGTWFYVDPTSHVFKAAHQAVEQVWGVAPDYTREGGSIPITLTLSALTGKDLCLIPMGRSDDGAHSQNEKLDVDTFMGGMKVFVHFLENLATM